MVNIEEITAMYQQQLADDWEQCQLRQMHKATKLPFFYDISELEYERSLCLDIINRELANMVMREMITEDEMWEIEDKL
jgi:hypothetical protein